MQYETLIADLPKAVAVEAAEVSAARDAHSVLVVLDDDPTGTQSVSQVPVLTRWEASDFAWAFSTNAPAVYVLTNTRSFGADEARRRGAEVVAAALSAAHDAGKRVTFVSRSDSTLRGHFPLETDVLRESIVANGGAAPRLTLLIPAFPEAGRVTVDGVHYWVVEGEATPVGESAFAQDASFGYDSSRLADWVEEKSSGSVAARDVAELRIATIRQGVDAVASFLSELAEATVVSVDVVEERDMRVVALALHRLDQRGITSLLRVGPPYVRAHIGQPQAAPVSRDSIEFANERGGLIVVGSHVPLTTAQLSALRADRPATKTIELVVPRLLTGDRNDELATKAGAVASALELGDVIVHTSRTLVTGKDATESLTIARQVSSALVELVARVLDIAPPRFVVAKGGITSSDTASEALKIRHAMVVGPMLPGIVSLWQPVDGPAIGIPYVVFAGNVGDAGSLAAVVRTLAD